MYATMAIQFVGVLFLCAVVSGAVLDDCPSSVPRDNYLQVLDDHCFYFQLKKSREFADAQKDCKKLGGDLAVPSTAPVDNFLIGHLKHTYSFTGKAWIGLHDKDTENTFQWVDGSPVSYTNFASREGPRFGLKHYLEDCVAIDAKSGLWRDYRCYSKLLGILSARKPYICQFEATPGPTPTV